MYVCVCVLGGEKKRGGRERRKRGNGEGRRDKKERKRRGKKGKEIFNV